MVASQPLRLFEAIGIELEYMIVGRGSLDVRSIADELIFAEVGAYESEIERGDIAWSNELALHVVELKTNGPTKDLVAAARSFQDEVVHANALLNKMDALLMPGAAHPWMDPERELRLWPHEHNPIYEAYDRIFGCRGHGWANLQSMHINLPFADDTEFGQLHSAVRMLMPIMPALAASSPILGGRLTGLLDTRLDVYRTNSQRVRSVTGMVVPEAVFSRAEYEARILNRIYADLAPLDPEGVLRHEWVNSRGSIARFDRMALEIRVLDLQECPAADLAIAAVIVGVLRSLIESGLAERSEFRELSTLRLARIMSEVIRDGDRATVDDYDYCRLLGAGGGSDRSALDVWSRLVEKAGVSSALDQPCAAALDVILAEGCLASRLVRRIGNDDRLPRIREIYDELTHCLAIGKSFRARP